jgi:hypothetical protein
MVNDCTGADLCSQVIGLITEQNFPYHRYRSISGQIQQFKCSKQYPTRNTVVSAVCDNRKTMQRFLTTRQFFCSAGYVVLMVDHGIITTFHTCFNNGGISWILWTPLKLQRLMVARGGITGPPRSPTRGFSDWLAYLWESLTATEIARWQRCCEWFVLELSRFTPAPPWVSVLLLLVILTPHIDITLSKNGTPL